MFKHKLSETTDFIFYGNKNLKLQFEILKEAARESIRTFKLHKQDFKKLNIWGYCYPKKAQCS